MAMRRIMLVGGAGFIGRHTARLLVEAEYTVHVSHSPNRKPAPLPGVVWHPSDLASPNACEGWPKSCEAVVYLAQSRQWRKFPEGAPDVLGVNIGGLLQSLEYTRRAGATHFIYTSTGSVYTQTKTPAREEEPIDLERLGNLYPASKLAGELLLRPYHSLFRPIILRLFMPYGAGQNADMLAPRLLRNVRQGLPIQLHAPDGLSANPVAVRDVAETIWRCLSLQEGKTMNVAGPELLTLREIGRRIGLVLGRDPVYQMLTDGTPGVIAGSTSVLEQTLNWRPAIRFEDGLRRWLIDETQMHALS